MIEKNFLLDGRNHNYTSTRINERCVEVSLGVDFFHRCPDPMLEVGNVLHHHIRDTTHMVIDLNEKIPGKKNLHNEDLLSWAPAKPFKSVLSISTVEHCATPKIGIYRLLSWAADALITIPLGYNCADGVSSTDLAMVDFGPDVRVSYMARGHAGMENWRQLSREEVKALPEDQVTWNKAFPMSASVICIIRKGPG